MTRGQGLVFSVAIACVRKSKVYDSPEDARSLCRQSSWPRLTAQEESCNAGLTTEQRTC